MERADLQSKSKQIEALESVMNKSLLGQTEEDIENRKIIEELVLKIKIQSAMAGVILITEGVAPEIIEDVDFLKIDKSYSSLINSSFNTDIILYKRTGLMKELEFLNDRVVSNSKIGWVVGPPGTGKSVAAFSFARSLASKGWRSFWVQFGRVNKKVTQFDQSKWWSGEIADIKVFFEMIDQPGRDDIVFLDGVRRDDADTQNALFWSNIWRKHQNVLGRGNRRLAIISSMSVRKSKCHEDERENIEGFSVESWSLDEFQIALQNDHLWNLVSHNIDADIEGSRSDRVVAKHFFAGGSARFMFERTTAQVKEALDIALSMTNDISKYLGAVVGDASGSVVNTLLGSHRDSNGKRYSFIASQYAALELSLRCGPETIRAISTAMRPYLNPAISGWLFEMLFMARISRGQLSLVSPKKKIVISCDAPQQLLESSSPANAEIFQGSEKWIKPFNWNQAGFDAVHVIPDDREIEFFQITMAAKHDLNFDHFAKFILNLESKQFQAHIYFVVPLCNLNNFEIIFKGNQALNLKGWSSRTKHVSILGMDNF